MSEPTRERPEVVGGRYADRDLTEPERGGARTGAGAVPRIHREVVVVAAGGDEERAVPLARDLEPESVDVERTGARHVTDLKVDVPDDGVGGVRLLERGLGEVLVEERVRVQAQRVHRDTASRPGPLVAVAVPVELDPVALGIGEVEGLRHEVVRATRVRPRGTGRDGRDRRGQPGLVVEQDCGVEQARLATTGRGEVRGVPQDDERGAAPAEGDRRGGVHREGAHGGRGHVEHLERDDVPVVRGHGGEVPDVERDGVEARAGRHQVCGRAKGLSHRASCGLSHEVLREAAMRSIYLSAQPLCHASCSSARPDAPTTPSVV